MELAKFAYFLKIAETGSISRAAAALRIAQPALSRFVRQLEEDLGSLLFERNGRGVMMTDAGRLFYHRAIDVLAKVQAAELEVAGPAGPHIGALTLGISPMLASALGPKLASRFRAMHPRVLLRISEARNAALFRWIEIGQADLVIGFREHGAWSVSQTRLLDETFHFVSRADRWKNPEQFDLGAMCETPLAMPPFPDVVRSTFEEALQRKGLSAKIICETDSLVCMTELVAAGHCGAIVPGHALPAFNANAIQAFRLDGLGLDHQIVVGTSAIRPVMACARLLLDELVSGSAAMFGASSEALGAAATRRSAPGRVHV